MGNSCHGPLASSSAAQGGPAETVVWKFDRLDSIGGHKTTVLGEPKVIDSPVGKASSSMASMMVCSSTITRSPAPKLLPGKPSSAPMAVNGSSDGFISASRIPTPAPTLETACSLKSGSSMKHGILTASTKSGTEDATLMNRNALHPLGAWYHVASVYDGKEFRNYVNGVQEGAASVYLAAHGPGHASVGMRINKVSYFKGAVHLARFTRKALSPFAVPPARLQNRNPLLPRSRYAQREDPIPRAHICTICPGFRQLLRYPLTCWFQKTWHGHRVCDGVDSFGRPNVGV